MRKLCEDLGLPIKGGKAQLEWRHREYVQLHNNACDGGVSPRGGEIIREVIRLEVREMIVTPFSASFLLL